jgi:hypothetical protein
VHAPRESRWGFLLAVMPDFLAASVGGLVHFKATSDFRCCSALNLFFGMALTPLQANFLTSLGPKS